MKENLIQIIESILFASDTPLSPQKIKEIIEGKGLKEIRKAIEALNKLYDNTNSALCIIEVAGGYQIVSRPEYAPFVLKFQQLAADLELNAINVLLERYIEA